MTIQPRELELPEQVHITPSKQSAWRSPKAPGAKYTYRQLAALRSLGVDPETVPSIAVRSTATAREMYWPTTEPTPVFVIHCPIIGNRRDGRHVVIAPTGQTKWVHPSGNIREDRHWG
ncbi:MAG: hypothetical protein KAY22_25720 [Rhizorhabdus sp.]|uniref:hypothetical protein n=1 Tax=Rhizorhabdus sp. TaxID=1968843 RepID=UPI001B48A077|nr:hypothetical protein [Rhizorhabdus sp.]MBP8235698.1 hypothetical protein [Rhizorhabdus sp.]